MFSEIQNTTPYYSKFENILPDELPETEITEELGSARNEINKTIEEDLRKKSLGRINLHLMSLQNQHP